MKDLDKFHVQQVYKAEKNIYRALLTRGEDIIRVEINSKVPTLEAAQTISGEIARMQKLFEDAPSPYPGEISDEIQCSSEFKPQLTQHVINDVNISSFLGYLNQRLVFGSCTKDQAIYRGILALFYCPGSQQLFQLEIITPKQTFDNSPQPYQDMLNSIQCK